MSAFNYEANEKLASEAEQDGDYETAQAYRQDAEDARGVEADKKAKVGVIPKGDITEYGDDAANDWENRLQAAAKGSSFGFADDAYGVVTTGVEEMFQSNDPDLTESDNNLFYGKDLTMAEFWDVSRERTKEKSEELEAWAAENTGEAILFEVLGGVLTGGAGLAKGATVVGGKVGNTIAATTAAGNLGTAGKIGSTAVGVGVAGTAEGVLYGVGTLDNRFDTATAQAEHVAKLAAIGFVGGTVIGGTFAGVGTMGASIANKARAVKKVQTQKDSDAIIDMVNEAYLTAKIDHPTATPDEMAIILQNSDVATMIDPSMLKAALAAGTQPLTVPNKATADMLENYQAMAKARQYEDVPSSWLSRKMSSENGYLTGHMDDLVGAVHTRVTNISPKIGAALSRNSYDTALKTQQRMTSVKGIERLNRKGNEQLKNDIWDMSLNDDVAGVLLRLEQHGDPVLLQGFKNAQLINSEIRNEFREVGMTVVNRQGGYWGRVVTDPAGLKKVMGSDNLKEMDKKILEFANEKQRLAGSKTAFGKGDINTARQSITQDEYSNILNQFILKGMRKHTPSGKVNRAAATERRSIDDPLNAQTADGQTVNLRSFYADPVQAITANIRRNTENIEERRLFGTSAGSVDDTIDVDLSVEKYLKDMGITDVTQEQQLRELLVSRFTMGKVAPAKYLQILKNIGMMTVLATPKAAAIQIADLAHSVLMNGTANTVKAVYRKNGITRETIGMGNKIGVEFDMGGVARWDVKSMDALINNRVGASIGVKKNGDEFGILGTTKDGRGRGIGTFFGFTDGFGKEVYMRAAFNKLNKQVQSGAGRNQFLTDYGKMFGRDTQAVMDELAEGGAQAPSRNLGLLMYTELAKIQPLDMSHMSQVYLDHPNGRIAYALKSFALKQLDIMRRRVAKPMAEGRMGEAAQFMAMYTTITGSATYMTNETRNAVFSLGADPIELPAIEQIPMELVWHIMGATAFINRYNSRDLGKHGNPLMTLAEAAVPPTGVVEGGIRDILKVMNTEWDDENWEFANMETVKNLPAGIGTFINMVWGDGREKKAAAAQTRADDAYERKYGVRPHKSRRQYKRN